MRTSHHPLYNVWSTMRARCLNPKATGYANYGGRGVTLCERWLNFPNFVADMGARPELTTLDRIDNAKGYEPSNCRWASRHDQQRNMRRNRWAWVGGVRMCWTDAVRISGIPRTTFYRLAGAL